MNDIHSLIQSVSFVSWMATALMAHVLAIHGPHSPEYVEAWEGSLQAMWFETRAKTETGRAAASRAARGF